MINSKIYPITAEFELELEKIEMPENLREAVISVVLEYEHGTADLEDVTLKQYVSVLLDFFLSL